MHTKKVFRCLITFNLIILMTDSVISEWIDIPQFSDESKVYRVPLTKPRRHQISLDKLFNPAESALSNSTEHRIVQSKRKTIQMPPSTNIETTTMAYIAVNVNDVDEYTELAQEVVTISNDTSQILTEDCDKRRIETLSGNTTTIGKNKRAFIKKEKLNAIGQFSFLENLPIALMRRAHRIVLGTTQTAIRDKREFLQKIQKSILRQLESGLTPLLISARRKRGSNWDDHHEHVGFPSLEGALLAISFLTFAVYLVQLMMMLLRNLASNGTPSPNTVLVNRNKRSIYQFPDDSVRILEYLERFSSNQ